MSRLFVGISIVVLLLLSYFYAQTVFADYPMEVDEVNQGYIVVYTDTLDSQDGTILYDGTTCAMWMDYPATPWISLVKEPKVTIHTLDTKEILYCSEKTE